MAESFYQSSVQRMNRLTGPAPCQCPITGPHQPSNPYCSRNALPAHLIWNKQTVPNWPDGVGGRDAS